MIIATGVVADRPTVNGNIYPRDVLARAIDNFNARARKHPSNGSELNPSQIDDLSEPTHITKKLMLDESGMVCAEIELLHTENGENLKNKISMSSSVAARPIMCVPNYIHEQKLNKIESLVIRDVHSIVRVQVECNGKHKRDNPKD